MSSAQHLREFISQRLTAAAEEIFSEFEKTIGRYEEEVGRQRRLLDVTWKPGIKLRRIDLPQHFICDKQLPADQRLRNQDKDSGSDREEPEPTRVKEEEGELCPSTEAEPLVLKQEADGFMVTPVFEESEEYEPEPSGEQLLSQSFGAAESSGQEGSRRRGFGSAGEEELKPKRRRPRNSRNTNASTAENPTQHHDSAEVPDPGSSPENPGLEQEEPEPQMKGELGQLCTSQEKEPFFLKLGTHEENDTTEPEPNREHLFTLNQSPDQQGTDHKPVGLYLNTELQPRRTHHRPGENLDDSSPPESRWDSAQSETFLQCDVCGKDFNFEPGMSTLYSSRAGERPYACNTCAEKKSQTSFLRHHSTIHTAERRYSCETCGKSYSHSYGLLVHVRTHTGEKPYSCKMCGKEFVQRGHLNVHMRYHLNDKRYSCETCGKSFVQKSHLQVHRRIHTGERPYSCRVCGKDFTQGSNLTSHMKIHTKTSFNLAKHGVNETPLL
ncbi:uncharacterized protein PAE49_017327 [Odontesthes bonariensis]|uniref:uncharacterized protein LOC142400869 n=1 Tax=Odontesthes bonariensis TaxID=219752 RepID=UPI003F583C69